MPDEWERRCKLNLEADDRRADPDGDGLTNADELQLGTLPCRPTPTTAAKMTAPRWRPAQSALRPG